MEDDLIRRAQCGDQRAFQQLVERYARTVWRTAAALLRDDALAEDAAQDAWVDVWKALRTFQPERPLRPWLLTVVANRCRMLMRRPSITTYSFDFAGDDLLTDVADTQNIEAQAIQTETDAELRAILATLPPDQCAILELHFFADLALTEIALVTDTPLGTVKSRLHRALQTLRTRLRPQPALNLPAEDLS
jgi:RNA polymerase sigma-70 factor, ECF subfamily